MLLTHHCSGIVVRHLPQDREAWGSVPCFPLSKFSSSAFPAISLGFTSFGESFPYDRCLFQPKIVTFHLHGWCVLGVFLLPVLTCLGCFESMRWNACVHRPDLSLYSHPSFGGMESEPMLTPRDKSPLLQAQRRLNHASDSGRSVSQHTTSYYDPTG